MKITGYLRIVFAALFLLLLCSCASSERMLRLSGSAARPPDVFRFGGGTSRLLPLDLGGNLVNLWPFYYRNSDYVSILWPVFDYDRNGFAVRPFFNQERDEYSVLFPLTAWNPVNGDGWCMPAYWRPDAFGAFPLFHVGPDVKYVLPVWFRNRASGKLLITPVGGMGWDETNSAGIWGPVWWDGDEKKHGVFPVWFYAPDYSCVFPLFYYRENNNGRGLLITPLGGGSWNEFGRALVFGNVYLLKNAFGAFPLFHWGEEFRYIGPAWWNEEQNHGVFPLYWNTNNFHAFLPAYWNCGENGNTGLFPLFNFALNPDARRKSTWVMPLFRYTSQAGANDHSMQLLTLLGGWGRNHMGEINFWHLLGPLLIRETSKSDSLTGIALFNWLKWSKLTPYDDSTRLTRIAANASAPEEVRREAAALLTPAQEFSEVKEEEHESYRWTTWPLVYWKNEPKQFTFKALPVDPFFLLPLVRYRTDEDERAWNFLWLFGGSQETTQRLKPYVAPKLIQLHNLLRGSNHRTLQQLEGRARNPAYTPSPDDAELAARISKMAGEAGFELAPDDPAAAWRLQRELEKKWFEPKVTAVDYYLPFWWSNSSNGKLTEWFALGGILGYGSQNYWESSYRLLGFLVRGKTAGERRELRILEFLYFSEHDGDTSRYMLFPFLTYENKGETESSFSFLWRMFSLRNRDGERSGHLFFIPFGGE